MATPAPDIPKAPGAVMTPYAFPTLTRDRGDLLWTRTTTATPEDLQLHLGHLLWKLWQDLEEVKEFVMFMATGRGIFLELPPWILRPGTRPSWATAIADADYALLDREQRGDDDNDDDEEDDG